MPELQDLQWKRSILSFLVAMVSILPFTTAEITVNPADYDRGDGVQPVEKNVVTINGWAEYDVEFEKTGYYILSAKYRHKNTEPITMKLNGERITTRLCKKGAGTESPWIDAQLFHLYIRAGKKVLRLEAAHSPQLRQLQFTPKRRDNHPALAHRLDYISGLLEDARAGLARLGPVGKTVQLANTYASLKEAFSSLDGENPQGLGSSGIIRDDLQQLRWEIAEARHSAGVDAEQEVALWPVNPLKKVFKSDPFPGEVEAQAAFLEACRNDYEPMQLCITSFDYIGPVRVEVGALVHHFGQHKIHGVSARFVGYVALHQQSYTTDNRGLEMPAMFPDPLILDDQVTLEPRQTRPVWITVNVPKDAIPGDYQGKITVVTAGGRVSTQLNVKVHPMVIPDQTNFWLGGWGGEHFQAKELGLEGDSPEYFAFLKHTLVNRFEHRSRTFSDVRVWNAMNLVKVTWKDGQYAYNYDLWDKIISLVEQTYRGQFRVICVSFGAEALANNAGLLFTARVLNPDGSVNQEKSFHDVFPNEPGYLEFIGDFFVNMQEHLRDKGWLEHVYFKVKDEINGGESLDHYRIVARHMKKVAPEIRQDATIGVPRMFDEEYIDLPVAGDGFFRAHPDRFEKEVAKGREIWFYGGIGDIDNPHMGIRGVGWAGYRYGLKGYHRWAYAWIKNAWENTDFSTPVHGQPKIISPGRDFVVYLDEKRKKLVDSIRWEMFRETQEDYEILLMAEKAGLDSKAICHQIAHGPNEFEKDPNRFYEVRGQLLMKLGELADNRTAVGKRMPSIYPELKSETTR